MAYQNIGGRPRFYINTVEWLGSLGVVSIDNIYRTLPVDPQPYTSDNLAPPGYGELVSYKWFGAILGHDLGGSVEGSPWYDGDGDSMHGSNPEYEAIVNSYPPIEYDGWSLALFGQTEWGQVNIGAGTTEYNIGSIIVGTYYDMPHSPELKLTMTREMDGVKKIRTLGGHDLIDHKYTKSPMWGNTAPWEIGDTGNHALSRVGRRSWDLSWNYLDDGDIFGPNMMLSSGYNILTTWGGDDEDYDFEDLDDHSQGGRLQQTILTNDNFFSQVLHRVQNRPFIFQPDSSSTAVDNFAICVFQQDSFSFQQQSSGLYSCKIKIREVW